MTDFVRSGDATDRSGTITAGDTAQDVMGRKASRRYFIVQNVSTEDLWINFNVDAVQAQPSIKLPPDAAYESAVDFVVTSRISIIGHTTGSAFTAKEA